MDCSTPGLPVLYQLLKASLVTQRLNCLPAMQETWVRSLGLGDPLEKGMAIYSSILAWEISWTEEPGALQSMGSQRVRHSLVTEQQILIPNNIWLRFQLLLLHDKPPENSV